MIMGYDVSRSYLLLEAHGSGPSPERSTRVPVASSSECFQLTELECQPVIVSLSPVMWTASLDHLFCREKGEGSLSSRLDPVFDRWWQTLELPPLLRNKTGQRDTCQAETDAGPRAAGEYPVSHQPEASTSQPRLVDVDEAPAYLQRPYIKRYYLVGEFLCHELSLGPSLWPGWSCPKLLVSSIPYHREADTEERMVGHLMVTFWQKCRRE